MHEKDIEHLCSADIMTPYIINLPMNSSLADCIQLMCEKHVSAIFFFDNSVKIWFILTHSDIVRILDTLKEKPISLSDILISTINLNPVKTLRSDLSIDLVIRFLEDNDFKRTLVEENGDAIGVISLSDVRKWVYRFFKSGKPQVLLFIDNASGLLVGKHIFYENIDDHLDHNLIDLYGGALHSISHITNEVLGKESQMRDLIGDNHSIQFEVLFEITGILISDQNSIELHQKLHNVTREFYSRHREQILNSGLKSEISITNILYIFD